MVDNVFAMAQVREGRLRVLAVSTDTRMQANADIPTMKELGVPMNLTGYFGLMVPTGTPKAVIDRLNGEIVKVVSRPDVKKAWNEQGAEPMSMNAAEFEKYLNDDIAKWAKVVKAAGIKGQ